MDKVGIVAVNYNSSKATKDMLESLISSQDYLSKVVIVDNGSTADDVAKLRCIIVEQQGRVSFEVKLITSNTNLGYFGGLNLGLLEINDRFSNGAIVCNNDVIFEKSFFVALMRKNLKVETFAVCPSVLTIDKVYQNPSMSRPPSRFRVFFYDLYYWNYNLGKILLKTWRLLGLGSDTRVVKDQVERNIFIGIGAIYYLTSSYFKKNTHLPNDTFLYGEEAFLSRQIKNSGGCLLYCPDLEVLHLESVSTRKLDSRYKYNLNREAYLKYKAFFRTK